MLLDARLDSLFTFFFFFNQETEKNPRNNASIENYIIAEIKERIKGREEV